MKFKIICAALCSILALSVSAQDNTKTAPDSKHPAKVRKEERPAPPPRPVRPDSVRRSVDKNSRHDSEKMAVMRADRLRNVLSLTEEQYKAVCKIYVEQAEKMEAERKAARNAVKQERMARPERAENPDNAGTSEQAKRNEGQNPREVAERPERPERLEKSEMRHGPGRHAKPEMANKNQQIEQESDKQIRALLNEEQLVKFNQLRQKEQQRASEAAHRHASPRSDDKGKEDARQLPERHDSKAEVNK